MLKCWCRIIVTSGTLLLLFAASDHATLLASTEATEPDTLDTQNLPEKPQPAQSGTSATASPSNPDRKSVV